MSLSLAKSSLRTELLRRRQQLDRAEACAKSASAQTLVLGLPAFRQARVLALYSPIRNEVETAALLREARLAGKTVCYPRVTDDELHFYSIRSPEDLKIGLFGVSEPAVSAVEIEPADIELMLVPGVVFDRSGNRLGYGRGYFDRFLSGSGFMGLSIGFCYDFQLVEKLPVEEHDQPLALLVSNEGIYSPLSSDGRVNHRLC